MNLSNLKKSLLNYAIEGNLSVKFRRENPTLNALKELEAYNQKIKLLKSQREQWKKNLEKLEKETRDLTQKQRVKSLLTKLKKRISTYQIVTPIDDDEEMPFEIPQSWVWVRLNNIQQEVINLGEKIPTTLFQKTGKYPIVSQEQNLISGYTSQENPINEIPLIVFGDHTCNIKYIDFPFFRGADGVKLLKFKTCFETYYLYFFLQSLDISTNKYTRHFKFIKNSLIPIPPLEEQKFICGEIEKLLSHTQDFELKAQQLQNLENNLSSFIDKSLLNYAIEGNLSVKFRRENPTLNALKELEAYNQKIKLLKSQREQWKKNLEKLEKKTGDLTQKQRVKSLLAKLKKRISTYQIVTPIDDDEISFEIPQSWVWVKLGDICKINPKNSIKDSLSVSFIPMALISDNFKNIFSSETRKWGDIKKNFTHLMNNAIAFAKITPCFQNQKSIILKDLKNGYGAGTTELIVLLPHDNKILNYLYFLVNSPYFIQSGEREMTGTAGQQRVPTEFVKNFIIPLPPLEEQKFICGEIEKLLTLCSQIK